MPRQYSFNIICHIILYNNKILKWFISLIHLKLCFYRYILSDEMNKTRSHLHMFSKKNHRCLKSSPSIFIIFWPSKIHVSPTNVVSSLFPLQCRLSSNWHHHATAPCHASFLWNQDEFATSNSSSDNTSSCRLSSRAETEAMNLHHRRWPPSPDSPTSTPTLYYYKKFILILATFPTTQLRLYFVSSLVRAPCHQSSTRHRRSLSPLFHAHRTSAQQH
jgi:hypothetical protein